MAVTQVERVVKEPEGRRFDPGLPFHMPKCPWTEYRALIMPRATVPIEYKCRLIRKSGAHRCTVWMCVNGWMEKLWLNRFELISRWEKYCINRKQTREEHLNSTQKDSWWKWDSNRATVLTTAPLWHQNNLHASIPPGHSSPLRHGQVAAQRLSLSGNSDLIQCRGNWTWGFLRFWKWCSIDCQTDFSWLQTVTLWVLGGRYQFSAPDLQSFIALLYLVPAFSFGEVQTTKPRDDTYLQY